jgi:hypothetical protein
VDHCVEGLCSGRLVGGLFFTLATLQALLPCLVTTGRSAREVMVLRLENHGLLLPRCYQLVLWVRPFCHRGQTVSCMFLYLLSGIECSVGRLDNAVFLHGCEIIMGVLTLKLFMDSIPPARKCMSRQEKQNLDRRDPSSICVTEKSMLGIIVADRFGIWFTVSSLSNQIYPIYELD